MPRLGLCLFDELPCFRQRSEATAMHALAINHYVNGIAQITICYPLNRDAVLSDFIAWLKALDAGSIKTRIMTAHSEFTSLVKILFTSVSSSNFVRWPVERVSLSAKLTLRITSEVSS